MTSVLAATGAAGALAWVYLLFFRGRFWRAEARLPAGGPPQVWPAVAVVVPARNEAATVARGVTSLVAQDYHGDWRVILADDASDDGTADLARAAVDGSSRLVTVAVPPLAPGWTGKPWALAAGIERAAQLMPDATYVLLTDADVVLDAGELGRLVTAAEAATLDIVSLMVRLNCDSPWERLLIPAFVFFFQKLYPFSSSRNSIRSLGSTTRPAAPPRRRAAAFWCAAARSTGPAASPPSATGSSTTARSPPC